MKELIFTLSAVLIIAVSCKEDVSRRPSRLISRDKMVNMLVDIHLTESALKNNRYLNDQNGKITESDLYYSILKKYNVPDSVFEVSLIYYSSKPKEFEIATSIFVSRAVSGT